MADFEKTSYGTKVTPYTEKIWKIPGYTGHISGIQDTYKKTPVPAQIETRHPETDESSFLHTRSLKSPKPTPERDPTNDPGVLKKPLPDNLWPHLQDSAIQESFKLPRSNIINGDYRIPPFHTSYDYDFAPAFPDHKTIRSPMRNPDLAAAGTLKQQYVSAFNRVTEKRLKKMIASMAERLAAKLGNSNNNAFRMRRLFKMYDKESTGQIQLEDFRQFMESFGIQLDDDSLLALFNVYDTEGTGSMAYEDLMRVLLDPDYFALYVGNVDNTQAKVDLENQEKVVNTIRSKFNSSMDDMVTVFRAMDPQKSGSVPRHSFLAACAALGITLNDKEMEQVMRMVALDASGNVKYESFLAMFAS